MRRAVRTGSLAAAMVLVLGCVAGGQERMPPMPPMPVPPMLRPPEASITVVGSGSVSARPDTADVTAGVVTQAPTAAQALAQNSASMDGVMKAAAAAGIPERDVQTTNVSVSPIRRQGRPADPQPPEIIAYEVSNQLRIKVRDLAKLGALLDALVKQGANVLGGIGFSVADPAPLLDQARAKAMADAKRRAEVYANAAGVALGRLLFISETGGLPVGRFETAMPRMMATAAVPVSPGEQEFQVSVTVSYGVK